MNIIEYGLSRIYSEIPIQMLQKGFAIHPTYGGASMLTLESLVEREVIRGKVLTDCNVIYGEQVVLDISALPRTQIQSGIMIQIPFNVTGGRKIGSVLGVDWASYNGISVGVNPLLANSSPNSTGTSACQLVGNNTIVISERIPFSTLALRCQLDNEANLSNFNQRAYFTFGNLCVLAAKMLIHTKLVIAIGESGTNGGSTNQATQSIVDAYSDSAELYNNELSITWRKTAYMNDAKTKRRHFSMGVMR